MSRNYHALTTKYNVLYNGDISLEQGKASINNAFTENFWDLLPVERMAVEADAFMSERTKNEDFDIAEVKAIKAIQRHGMNINGREKNPQTDEAYLLLGKARYYDQRFVPALAAFNNILNKYPTSDKINKVKIWREKSNMRLENNKIAIKNLTKLIEEADLDQQDLADATATLAQAYIKVKAKDSALAYLGTAAKNTKIKEERARYQYIRGQLFNEFGQKDSASLAFDAIINMHRQIPRAYFINANLQKLRNEDWSNIDNQEFEETLAKIEENRENRPFLDKIYRLIGDYHRSSASDSIAQRYYNQSLKKSQNDKFLTAMNYETLGDMYFDKSIYKTAGAYYDSTMTAMEVNTKPYRTIKKKRNNLDDVIYYEGLAQANDSILHLISLPKSEQMAFFSSYVERLKQEAIAKQAQEESARQKAKNISTDTRNNGSLNNANTALRDKTGSSKTGNRFYFYNPTTVKYGKNEFVNLWGNRKLQDNWRLLKDRANTQNTIEDISLEQTEDNQLLKPEFYLVQLPIKSNDIDSITQERNFAYYQLGIIYKEKFEEYVLAKDKLESLLSFQPEDRLVLPSKYNLYRIYKLLDLQKKADIIKNDIVSNYPESRYAEILLNPKAQLAEDQNSPDVIYSSLYKAFNNQDYLKVIESAEQQIKKFEGEPIVPKLELLKASAKGRLYGFEAYKEGVNYTALTYPNTEEGKAAQRIIQEAIPALAKNDFVDNENAKHFNIIYTFQNDEREVIGDFVKVLDAELEKMDYFVLRSSVDVYDQNTTFVVVTGLKSINGAKGFAEQLQGEKNKIKKQRKTPKILRAFFAISSPNYAILQRHKNLSTYIKFL